MNSLKHHLTVSSTKPPVVEWDPSCRAIYVRFSSRAVARTLERSSTHGMIITIDLDRGGEVVGIEGIGFDNFSLSALLKSANVQAERVDLAKARWRSTPRFADPVTA
jgi:uncharacterized protein YuzE